MIAVLGVWLTIKGDLQVQARAEAAQTGLQNAQATAELLAESGDAFCAGIFTPIYQVDPFIESEPNARDEICRRRHEIPPSLPVQREFIRQLVEHPEQREAIVAMWRAGYEPEEWIDEIERALHEAGR